ncbi:hypothetical protein G6F56_013926 [Rhizopus delemar]|nr:hypothetical protein G6F56_013926 [Rhizopus delemar]
MVWIVFAKHVVQQARRGLQLAKRTRHAAGQAGPPQARHARDAAELAACQLAQVHRCTQVVQQPITGEQHAPLRCVQIDGLRRCQHQAMVVHRIADAVALHARATQRQQRRQCLVHVTAGKGRDEQELAVAAAVVLHQQMLGRGPRRHALLQGQQRSQPS